MDEKLKRYVNKMVNYTFEMVVDIADLMKVGPQFEHHVLEVRKYLRKINESVPEHRKDEELTDFLDAVSRMVDIALPFMEARKNANKADFSDAYWRIKRTLGRLEGSEVDYLDDEVGLG